VRLRPEILAQAAYQQGKPARANDFKLSSNELPFAPTPRVLDAVAGVSEYNRYPDASARVVRERLAERFGVSPDEVLIGNGSVSLLYQAVLATSGPGDEVVYPWRSFEAYPGMAVVAGATSVQVPLTAGHALDLDAMADAVTERTRLVIVCTPNNPTGTTVQQADLDAFLDRIPSDVLVIVDEAYAEFVTTPGAVDATAYLGKRPNVILARTFSKAWGLAGLRIGYFIGDATVLQALRTAGIPLSVTGVAQAAALAALDDEPVIRERVAEIVERRGEIQAALREQGWDVPDSDANFVWLPTGERTAEIEGVFREHGVIVRALGDGIRVSIGEAEATDPLLAAAAEAIGRFPELARA